MNGLIKRGLKNDSTLELILERRELLAIHPKIGIPEPRHRAGLQHAAP